MANGEEGFLPAPPTPTAAPHHLPFLPAQRSNGSRAVLHVSAPGTAVVVALARLKQFSVVEVVPQLDVEARAEHDAEQLEDRQTQAHGPEDDQVILRRLEKLVDATLNRIESFIISNDRLTYLDNIHSI